MGFIASSERPRSVRTVLRSAVEGGVLAALAVAACRAAYCGALTRSVAVGIFSAWAASTASVAALVFARERGQKDFWWAFGGGMALRLALLAVLMFLFRDAPSREQSGTLVGYALGVLFLLLLEYRSLSRG